MPRLRIIPTILVKRSMAVKGKEFDNWRVVGTAQAVAALHGSRKVDELVVLDVSASEEQRVMSPGLVNALASRLTIPFSVGGGISSVAQAHSLFEAGADKILVGKSWRLKPELVTELSYEFGSQSICCTIDAVSPYDRVDGPWRALQGRDLRIEEAGKMLQDLGAGELLLNNIALDGTMKGIDIQGISNLVSEVNIPVIAASGANEESFSKAFDSGASAVAAGALFQFTKAAPSSIRNALLQKGYDVRQKVV